MEEIMIIEDDADLREILKFSLERAGYKTYEAESAENGLEMMNDRIRLILLDVMLPGMSGTDWNVDTGSGLGLSVVRNAVGFHGGEIKASLRPEGGLSFEMTLPLSYR